MSENLSLSEMQSFVGAFMDPKEEGRLGKGNDVLLQGVVSAIDATTGLVSVFCNGTTYQKMKAISGGPFYVGQIVWILKDGNNRLLLGALGESAKGAIAWARYDMSNGGVGYGKFAITVSAGTGSIGIGSGAQQWLSVGVQNISTTPGRLLRLTYRGWAFGPVDAANEWYFYILVNLNNSSFGNIAEIRQSPSGANAPAPYAQTLYVTPPGCVNIGMSIDAKKNAGTGTLFRYNLGDIIGHSFVLVEDLGPAY